MRHNLPPTPAFRDSPPTEPIQEIALRVVVELPEWKFYVIGTATLIGGHLAVTAKHVIEAVTRKFGARQVPGGAEVSEYSLRSRACFSGLSLRHMNRLRFACRLLHQKLKRLHDGGSKRLGIPHNRGCAIFKVTIARAPCRRPPRRASRRGPIG